MQDEENGKTEREPAQLPQEVPEESGDTETVSLQFPDEASPELRRIIVRKISFSGPLPPPGMLRAYEETLPGLADRLMCLTEREQEIRKENNSRTATTDRTKVVGSVLVSLGLIAGAVLCALLGQPWVGVALATSTVIPSITKILRKQDSGQGKAITTKPQSGNPPP